jgi:hypothetical protein
MRLECPKKPVPPAAMFKLIRRFLVGTSPFFLQFSTAHPSAACGFSKNSTTRFPFLFISRATPLFPRTAKWVVGVSTHWYRANDIPVVEHRGIKSLHAAGDVPSHLDQIIRNRAVYPLNRGGFGKGSVVKTARNFPTENCQRIRIVVRFILVFQSGRPTDRNDFGRAGCHREIGRIGNLRLYFISDRSARRNLQAVSHRSRISPYCIHDRFSAWNEQWGTQRQRK